MKIVPEFTIDPIHFESVTHTEVYSIYANRDPATLTPEELLKMVKGEDIVRTVSSKDPPEFDALREQLGQEGFIKISRVSWNGDIVIKPFKLNGIRFKKNDTFYCAGAMRFQMSQASFVKDRMDTNA